MSDLSNVGHRFLITFLSDVSAEVARCVKDNLRATNQLQTKSRHCVTRIFVTRITPEWRCDDDAREWLSKLRPSSDAASLDGKLLGVKGEVVMQQSL